MLHTTRAVVLRTFKHGDRTVVLRAYTEAFGTRSYAVRIGKKDVRTAAALQPLSRVELVVTEAHEREMHLVREMRVERPFTALHGDPMRGLLLLFAQEVLYRTLRQESADAGLFDFVQEVVERIDTGTDMAGFPLFLLVHLSKHLGILPEPPGPGEEGFDMREGQFFQGDAPHELCMRPAQGALFGALVSALSKGGPETPIPSGTARRSLLDDLLVYYRLHVEGFGELRSPEVLHQLLH